MFNFAAFFYCKLLVLHTKFLQIKNSDKKSVVFTKQLHVIFLLIGLLENMCMICSRKRNWSDQPSGGGWLAGLVYKPFYISLLVMCPDQTGMFLVFQQSPVGI